ncbi:hypothetical protein [Streptomyces buecherae]|uniref:golvesin C-terminal-like domain-containing protein n=1 Tax=Streptomyces buecherae TaxID=2763006 RepID=UPI0036932C94
MAPERRDALLGKGWRNSADRAWTATGDAEGFHISVADARTGYTWRTAASLSEQGFDVDQWVGNACLTGSGRRAVVVYAPRSFTNKAELFDRGGFVAVVDLDTGRTTKLRLQASLAYYSPGCGVGETAVLTRHTNASPGATHLVRVDAATGKLARPVEVKGQLTSAVPVGEGIVGADNGRLVRVADNGRRTTVAVTHGVPFHIKPDAEGGLVFMDRQRDRGFVRRAQASDADTTTPAPAPVRTLAEGDLTALGVTSGAGGRVFITGKQQHLRGLPGSVRRLPVAKDAVVSSLGQVSVAVSAPTRPRGAAPERAAPPAPPRVSMRVLATDEHISFAFAPGAAPPADAASGKAPHPVLARAPGVAPDPVHGGDATNPVEEERTCSVPRNDPRNQAMQPKPRQVEWAADQAVRGALTVQRPANWKNLGMPAYSPQHLFPPIPLEGGGNVPAQILLGIAAQESNLWQSSRIAVPGVTSSPLIGNYYGRKIYDANPGDDWDIHWEEADCGYGVTQVTDGMRKAGHERPNETALPYQTQRAVALDFAANVAAGLRILQEKWNLTTKAGMRVNNGDPAKMENWFYALWAYNSGMYPREQSDPTAPWGLGWANNPANPSYPANRAPFLELTYADAAKPQNWPYPEKVLGWAGHPVEVLESPGKLVSGFRAAWWNGTATTSVENRKAVKPPVNQFCDPSNNCDPNGRYKPNAPGVENAPAGPCAHTNAAGQYDLKCWYHNSTEWKENCDYTCGNELLRFSPGYAYQDDGSAYPPVCSTVGLPANAMVIDDLPDGTPSVRPDCGRPWTNRGEFSLSFTPDAVGDFPSKVDFHQLGAGFGGHFWFAHSRKQSDKMKVSGTWKLDHELDSPAQLLVHLPDHGAQSKKARYEIHTARGVRTKVVSQPSGDNRWVSLGAYLFKGAPKVTLSSVTTDGTGDDDIAFDAMAVVPMPGSYVEHTVDAVAVFDENQNLDTALATSWISGIMANRKSLYDWGKRTSGDIVNLPACTGGPQPTCVMPRTKAAMQSWHDNVVEAGTDPVDHPAGKSIAQWLNFSNPSRYRPTGAAIPTWFETDEESYKIKSKTTVGFIKAPDGKVIPGSEFVRYDNRTSSTHLPEFVRETFRAVAADYGITAPDLTYTLKDAGYHDGRETTSNTNETGVLPARAYAYAGKNPVVTNGSSSNTEPDENGTCVSTLQVSGGVIGYRTVLANAHVPGRVENWQKRVYDDKNVPPPVTHLAHDIHELFFNPGGTVGPPVSGSVFGQAPPIWQELNFQACADGSIRKVGGRPLLRASHMPDHYLYHNGRSIDDEGAQQATAKPVMKGDFPYFSRLPDPNTTFPLWENPYGPCTTGPHSLRSGNPWDVTAIPPQSPGINPQKAHFCVGDVPPDPDHTSD